MFTRLMIAVGSLIALMCVDPSFAESGPAVPVEAHTRLAQHLARHPNAIVRDASGEVTQVFGVPIHEVETVFAPVSQTWQLPLDWVPPDLVRVSGVMGQPARHILRQDLETMLGEAHRDGAPLNVLSAYRSAAQQAQLFESGIARQIARAEGPISREEAEARAMRFNARPGHSQHQLGTAIDFTSPEIGYGIGARFAATLAGEWLAEHSWRFGFVFPYTREGEARSGYAYEPWHVRWVGRELAAVMHQDGYVQSASPIADDYVLAVHGIVVSPPLVRTE